MKFYMRLPLTEAVSLMGLVRNTSDENNTEIIEMLVSLTESREAMRLHLKEQDKITNYHSALVMLNAIKKYLADLQTLEKMVAEHPSLQFTLNIVFIWRSALVETALGGMSGFYTKKLINSTKSENKSSIKNLSQTKLAFKNAITSKLNVKTSSKLVRQDSLKDLSTAAQSSPENSESPTAENSIGPGSSGILVNPFNQKQSQDPHIEFEKANTLLALGISKVLLSYTLFDNFEVYFDSELTNQMLPVDSSSSLSSKKSSVGDSKNLNLIKKINPFKKSKDKNGNELLEAPVDDWAQKIPQAVKELRESAKIFHYILSELSQNQDVDLSNSDLNPTVLLMLQKISLADADRLVASNAIKMNYKPTIASRMLLYASEQYDLVLKLSKSLKLDSLLSINKDFLTFIKKKKKFVYGLALIFLAKASFEKNEHGLSVAYIREAKSILSTLASSKSKSLSISKSNSVVVPNIDSILEQTEMLYAMYTRNNDTFGFEHIPSSAELQAKIPLGRPFNEISTYNPADQTTQYF